MMKGFDPNELLQVLSEKGLPVVGGDNDGAVFRSNELADVDGSRRVHDRSVNPPTLVCLYLYVL